MRTMEQEWLNMFGILTITWIIRILIDEFCSLMKRYTHFSNCSVEHIKLLWRAIKFNSNCQRNKFEWIFCICRNSVLIHLFTVYALYKMASENWGLGVRIEAVHNYHQRLVKSTTI